MKRAECGNKQLPRCHIAVGVADSVIDGEDDYVTQHRTDDVKTKSSDQKPGT
jgi:hypothetical protein